MQPIDSDAFKAVLEGMIFVSVEPVTTKQMLTKLNQIYKKQNTPEDTIPPEPALAEPETAAEEPLLASAELAVAPETEASAAPEVQDESDDETAAVKDGPIALMQVKTWVSEIQAAYASAAHGFELVAVARGYQFRTKLSVAEALQTEKKPLPGRLSASAMETLAVVAYEQPVTRAKIDDVRGVDSSGVLKTLLERDFLRIIGRADEPGQPLLYGTTNKFLEVFHLEHLKDLPSLNEIRDLYLQADDESSDEPARYFDPEDVIEQRVQAFSEEEMELMQELDQSLTLVKNVEQSIDILNPAKKAEDEAVANAAPNSTLH